MHMETSLNWLEQCMTELGHQLRRFKTFTCSTFKTKELPKEEAAHGPCWDKKKTTVKSTSAPASKHPG